MDPTQPTPQSSPQPNPLPPTSTIPTAATPPTILDQPQVVTQSVLEPTATEPPKHRSILKRILSIAISLLILLLVAGSSLAYAVAYDKIKLTQNPDLQNTISYFVQNVSFMPKTPKFVLSKAALAQEKVSKESFDISLAASSADFSKMFNLNSIDLAATGKIDYTDSKDPNVAVNLSITKDFNLELRKSDPILYFKINKLPGLLLAAIGLKPEQFSSVTGKWIALDTTPLQTEARKNLEDKEVKPFSKDYINENLENFVDDKILKEINMEKTTMDGNSVYKLTLSASPDIIDYLGQKVIEESKKTGGAYLGTTPNPDTKLSDMVKRLAWEFDIDQKDYYIRKIVISTSLEVDSSDYGSLLLGTSSSASTKSKVDIAFAVKLADFGKEVVIDKPDSSMTFEEFTNTLSDILKEIYGDMLNQAQASEPIPIPTPQP